MKIDKIILGTAQLGLDYGINNSEGKPSLEKSFDILNLAYSLGIRTLDTAEAYGDAHKVIELFHNSVDFRFKIITKYSSKVKEYPVEISKRIEQHCKNFDLQVLEGYMFHSHDELKKALLADKLILKKLNQNKFVRKIGVSVYTNSQVEDVLNYKEIDLIQLPFNLFDNESLRKITLLKAKDNNIEIHTRSAFFQGLFFKDIDKLKGHLLGFKKDLFFLDEVVKRNKIKKMDLALNYPISKEYIDKVLIGVDNVKQLHENIKSLNEFKKWSVFNAIDNYINIINKELLNPSKWDQ